MAIIPVTIKWAGQKPFDIEVDTDESGATLKMQIYSITGVETDRQKLLVKGGALKDEQDLSKLGLKPKQTLMLMGSATELPKAPATKIIFMEDMDPSELALASKSPPGLQNLGNTVSSIPHMCILMLTSKVLHEFYPAITAGNPRATDRAR